MDPRRRGAWDGKRKNERPEAPCGNRGPLLAGKIGEVLFAALQCRALVAVVRLLVALVAVVVAVEGRTRPRRFSELRLVQIFVVELTAVLHGSQAHFDVVELRGG